MAEQEFMTANEVCEYLGISRNNLYQITIRFKRNHTDLNHEDNGVCPCILVEFKGRGKNRYRADRIAGYAMYRRGEPNEIGKIMMSARKIRKVQKPGKTLGRPTTRTEGKL